MSGLKISDLKIFVVHYKLLKPRKREMIAKFEKFNITNYEFIEIDRNELTEEQKNVFVKDLSKVGAAISLSHHYAYKEIADKYDHALILEDDVIFADNFIEKFNTYLSQLPADYDMLFIGNGCNLHIENHRIVPNQYIYEKCLHPTDWGGNGATRCTDSYIVSKKFATKICDYMRNLKEKISEVGIDWWLNGAARDCKFKVYWAEPTIVTQGSQTGTFQNSFFAEPDNFNNN